MYIFLGSMNCLSVRCRNLWCPGFMPLIRNVLSNFQGLRQGHAISLKCIRPFTFVSCQSHKPFEMWCRWTFYYDDACAVYIFVCATARNIHQHGKKYQASGFFTHKYYHLVDAKRSAANFEFYSFVRLFACSFIRTFVLQASQTAHTIHFDCTFPTSNCHSIYQYFIRWMNMTKQNEQSLLLCLCLAVTAVRLAYV